MIRSLLSLLRPHQWTKNTLVFAGVIFGGRLRETEAILLDLAVFGIFCAASSAAYIFNDVVDRERDRAHPRKRKRPIASGAVGVPVAVAVALVLAGVALGGATLLERWTLGCVALYFLNNLVYTTWLKNHVLFDVLPIAFGFILRLLAGIYVLGDLPTAWIVLCTFFMAVFLGFAKRRAELFRLTEPAPDRAPQEVEPQRPVLAEYTVEYLDQLLGSAATMAIMCYALLTVASDKNPTLVVTLPIVYYAIMHYKRRVMVGASGEEPEMILLRDVRILGSIFLWLVAYVAIEYFDIWLFQ